MRAAERRYLFTAEESCQDFTRKFSQDLVFRASHRLRRSGACHRLREPVVALELEYDPIWPRHARVLLRREAPLLARTNPQDLTILLPPPRPSAAPKGTGAGPSSGKRKAAAPAASAAPSRSTARGSDSDSDYDDGVHCPSDDELPPSEASGDEGGEESDEESEVEAAGGAAAAKGKKGKKKKLTKAG